MSDKTDIDFHPFTDVGRRERQEDFFYTDPPMRDGRPWLGALADGMGGHRQGDLASKAGVHALKSAFDAAIARGVRVDEALVAAVTSGHEAVLEVALKADAVGDMGSTVVAFAIEGQTLTWCSAGDSRLYLYRGDALLQLSRDFTLGEDMRQGVNNGDWSQQDIDNSPQRHALTSFMGTDNWRYHKGSRALQPGDIVIACSDGVYGTIDVDGIKAACRSGGGLAPAQQVAANLLKRVQDVAKPNQDNSTAIVVRFVSKPPLPAPAEKPAERGRAGVYLGGGMLMLVAMALGAVVLWRGKPTESGVVVSTSAASAPASALPSAPAASPAQVPASAAKQVAPVPPPAPSTTPTFEQRLATLEKRIDDNRLGPEDVPGVLTDYRNDLKDANVAETRDMTQRLSALQERATVARMRQEFGKAGESGAAKTRAGLVQFVRNYEPKARAMASTHKVEATALVQEAKKQLAAPKPASPPAVPKKKLTEANSASSPDTGANAAAAASAPPAKGVAEPAASKASPPAEPASPGRAGTTQAPTASGAAPAASSR